MNSLYLTIKQEYFDQILAGTKTEEFREIRPNTFKRYCRYLVAGEEFKDLEDIPDEPKYLEALDKEGFDVVPIKYDALNLCVGYRPDRDTMLVEVTGATIEYFVDENGEPIYYEHKGNEYCLSQMVYSLGRILDKNVHQKPNGRKSK